ncbi:MAG: TolC family protein [Candidatus Pedobacter colombiensis]|uniref:TolC family protein n=1 Tax=Candidatus Pedobacter colombiensis TaxID=3121371 RepID=A0AAJ5W6D2_9SPHI|nr:TolC family protein [Pedobacter sp.]WEK18834.1 MAG: TolC family protein [Pedobacter sp.]
MKRVNYMRGKRSIVAFCLMTVLSMSAQLALAQQKLDLQEAISIALKNNYDIKLVNNNVQIAKNNVNPGNAGMLPQLNGNFSDGGSRQNITRTQSNGNQQTLDGVRNTSMNYGAALGWTIFDGLQMFTNYERLKELQKLGEVNAKATILTTVSNVISAYYTVLKEQQLIMARDSALDISQLRLKIANNKLTIGRGSKLDVLAAQVDYNTDTSAYLQEVNLLKTAKTALNQVMARDLNVDFKVADRIDIDAALDYATLEGQTTRLNPDLQSALINKKIAELNLKQVKGQRYPTVGINSGYEFQKSASPTGFNTQQRSTGLTYGVTASVNIFNGFLQRQNERNAKIGISSSELTFEKTKLDINAQLLSTYQNYSTNLDLLKVEKSNMDIARQNIDITLDKYRLGSISPLELREAQRNFINAIIRYLNAEYEAKLTEISLKEISGTLNIQ